MKNNKRTLVLNRETLKTLDLRKVQGGIQQQEDLFMIISCFCSADCP